MYVHVKYMCVSCMYMIMWVCAYMHPCTCTSGVWRLASAAFHLYSLIFLESLGLIVELCLPFSIAVDILETFAGVIDIREVPVLNLQLHKVCPAEIP